MTEATESPWLAARRKGLTGTDAAAVLGITDWKSPIEVWLEKCHPERLEGGLEDTERMYWGRKHERNLVETYDAKTRRVSLMDAEAWDVLPPEACTPATYAHSMVNVWGQVEESEKTILSSTVFPWMLCTPDFLVEAWAPLDTDRPQEELEGRGLGEAKTTDSRFAADWDDDPPQVYTVQALHNTLVANLRWFSIPVLIGGNDTRVFDIARPDDLAQLMVEEEGRFWDEYVLKDIEPPWDEGMAAKAQARVLKLLHPKEAKGQVALVQAGDKLAGLGMTYAEADDRLQTIAAWKNAIDKEAEEIKNRFKRATGDAERLELVGTGYGYNWKTVKKPAGKPVSYRDFRRSKSKEVKA